MHFTNLEKRKKKLEAPLAPAPQLGIELGTRMEKKMNETSATLRAEAHRESVR